MRFTLTYFRLTVPVTSSIKKVIGKTYIKISLTECKIFRCESISRSLPLLQQTTLKQKCEISFAVYWSHPWETTRGGGGEDGMANDQNLGGRKNLYL